MSGPSDARSANARPKEADHASPRCSPQLLRSRHRPVPDRCSRAEHDESDRDRRSCMIVRQLEGDVQPRFEAADRRASSRRRSPGRAIAPGETRRRSGSGAATARAERSGLPVRARADQDQGKRRGWSGVRCDRSRRRPAAAARGGCRSASAAGRAGSTLPGAEGAGRPGRLRAVRRAPEKLGGHRVAVVLPTQTWQAYNFRDDDGDGKADTWYADPEKNYEPG